MAGRLFAAALALCVAGCGGGGAGSSEENALAGPAALAQAAATDGIASVVARTGPVVTVRVGETATLDGSKSLTSSSQPLSFQWSFSARPDASNAELLDATFEDPSFVADASGAYVAQLVVSAEGVTSKRAVQLVMATVPPEPGTFHDGLSSNCVNCHSDAFSDIPGKPSTHVATSDMCATCHGAKRLGFSTTHSVDHAEVFGSCSECHNGVLAVGKSEFHAPTNAECDDCHNTSHFLLLAADGSFDHSGITRSCNGCHNGLVAKGQTPTPPHPDTASECGCCHTTATFLDAFPDHTGPDVVGNRCDSCHGVIAAGPSMGHPEPFVDCGACHSVATFSHDPQGDYPGDHRTDPGCSGCHGASVNAVSAYPSPRYAPFCAACHERDFERKGNHIGGENGTVEQNKDCSGGGRGCHSVTDSKFD